MRFYLLVTFLSVCMLSSCNKVESNQVEILITVAPSDINYTINSDIGQLSNKIVGTNNLSSIHNFGSMVELSTSSIDTFLINTKMSVGAFEISNFGIDLYGAIISQESEEIINSTEDYSNEFGDFTIEVSPDGGETRRVLFELDLEKSLSMDNDGNKVFEPSFTIKEI